MKIESTQNKTIKELAKLQQKKYRDETGRFLVEGMHCLQEAARAGILEQIYTVEEDTENLWGVEPVQCSQHVLDKLSVQKSAAKWIGVCRHPENRLTDRNRLLLLQDIQDPGNLGTLIRSAVAFGMDGILLSSHCADIYSPKTIQSSQGAVFHIPCIRCDLLEFMDNHPDLTFYGTALHTDSQWLKDTTFSLPCALILGSEGQGLDKKILARCTKTVTIEMADFESLNVAAAGSICMYQIFRQTA